MKNYVKPDLYYENFELSQHVATCAWDMTNFKSISECSAEADPDIICDYGVNLFTSGNSACNLLDEDYDDYCYTNGGDGNNVFNS